jgi:hypothetical protein
MKDEKRCKRIMVLINRLSSGEDVSRRSLARVLSPEQLANLDANWLTEKSTRNQKPPQIKQYEEKLRIGLLHYSRTEQLSGKVSQYTSSKLSDRADGVLDAVIDYARELVDGDQSFLIWFDRDPRSGCNTSPAGVPRIITSKSFENRATVKNFDTSKRDLKISALSDALELLQRNSLENIEHQIVASLFDRKGSKKGNFDDFQF